MRRFALVLVFATVAFALARAEAPHLVPYTQEIPGTTLALPMAPVPFRGDAPGFWIERHEVTQAEFDVFRAATAPDGRAAARRRPSPALSSFPDVSEPSSGSDVILATQAEAAAYAAWVSRETGRTYRLPTETEWEQACLAGEDDATPLEARAWFAANAGARPHPLGTRAVDRLGLVDMLGNLPEWTADGAGPPAGTAGALKGGSWSDAAEAVACTARRPWGAGMAGFRLVRPYSDRSR